MASTDGIDRADGVTVAQAAQDHFTLHTLLDLHDRAVNSWAEIAEDNVDQLRLLELLDRTWRDLHANLEALRPAVPDNASLAASRQAALKRMVERGEFPHEEA
jgi:hypothetical protein